MTDPELVAALDQYAAAVRAEERERLLVIWNTATEPHVALLAALRARSSQGAFDRSERPVPDDRPPS
jgi:hypothetical protein